MSSKHEQRHRASKEAVALRAAAKEFWAPHKEDLTDPNDKAGHARWRVLSRAAVQYAKLLLAGQCIPPEREP